MNVLRHGELIYAALSLTCGHPIIASVTVGIYRDPDVIAVSRWGWGGVLERCHFSTDVLDVPSL